jgi:ankyrin repeat protein
VHIIISFVRLTLLSQLLFLIPQLCFGDSHEENVGNTPLMISAAKGDISLMKTITGEGTNINETNIYGLNALMFAAGAYPAQPARNKGNTEALKLLLEHGAKVNATSKRGFTALMFAAENRDNERVKLLLNYGADVNALNNDGQSALMLAARRYSPDIVDLLLNNNARINGYADMNGYSALMVAIASLPFTEYEPPSTLGLVLTEELTNDAKLNLGLKVIQLLLEYGADVNYANQKGQSALTLASYGGGHEMIVNELLNHRANPNQKDQQQGGATPLIMVVKAGNLASAKRLVEMGADVNIKDQNGNSALRYALSRRDHDMSILLMKAGATKE